MLIDFCYLRDSLSRLVLKIGTLPSLGCESTPNFHIASYWPEAAGHLAAERLAEGRASRLESAPDHPLVLVGAYVANCLSIITCVLLIRVGIFFDWGLMQDVDLSDLRRGWHLYTRFLAQDSRDLC